MSLPPQKSTSGFTLIELLISMTILGILFGLGIPSYRSFQANQELEQVKETLKSDLRFAQSQASAGVKNCGAGTLIGWYVRPDIFISLSGPGGYVYFIRSRCGSSSVTYKTVRLPQGMSMIISPATVTDTLFQPNNQNVVFVANAATVAPPPPPITSLASEITITLAKAGRSKIIYVRQTGDIYE